MLDQKDIEIIRSIMKEEISGVNAEISGLEERINIKIDSAEKRLTDRMNEMEDNLYDEIGKTQTYLEKQIQAVQKNMDELNQYYRITKLENDNTALLLKIINDLQERVEKLEKKSA